MINPHFYIYIDTDCSNHNLNHNTFSYMKSNAITDTDTSCASQAPIAIIGMGCIFPESRNLKEFWHLLFKGIDAVSTVPENSHWQIKDYFNEDPTCPDHTYCTRGGFIPDIAFDPLSYGIPPNNIDATDTSQLLGLEVVRMALADAGYPIGHDHLKEKRVNVILGVTGTQELVIPLGARLGHPFWKRALDAAGVDQEKKEAVLKHIAESYVSWQENSFPGLLGNVVAGRIANRLDLSGTNTVCDAACASSLSAIHTAIMELETGRCDMSITGGVDTLNDIFMHMCFSKTGVLSHTSDARPFSEDADGTVLGEGIGMLVLKRLDDAQRDNDRIYAVIKGMGTASDGRTSAVYAPEAKGQVKALEDAYGKAAIDPGTVGLIEAHGTGTRVGDKVEFSALKQFFNASPNASTAIGSVKSMIGHAKAAAGAAGIIKAALALHNKVIPPTLKAQTPDPDLDILNSPFYLNQASRPWIAQDSTASPRRSGVSAFGFGGSNFHAILEEYIPEKEHVSWDGAIQIFALSAQDKNQLVNALDQIAKKIKPYDTPDRTAFCQAVSWQACESRNAFKVSHEFRLLFLVNEPDTVFDLITQARNVVTENTPAKPPVFFGSKTPSGKLGFIYPGQGSQYTGMGSMLISQFPEGLQVLNQAQACVKNIETDQDEPLLSTYMYPLPEYAVDKTAAETALRQTRIAQPAIGALSLAMTRILARFKVVPDMTCGHSYGELCALYAAGWLDEKTCLELSAARGHYMGQAGEGSDDPGSMLAVKAAIEKIEELIKDQDLDLVLANKNSPTQGVLSGETPLILEAEKLCKQKKMRAVKLPVAAAFHSRLVADAAAPFKALTAKAKMTPSKTVVLSNTTGAPYPEALGKARDLLGQQLMHPVNFIGNIEYMNSQGVDTFIEVGPKTVLCGLVRSILKDKEIQTLALDKSGGKNSGIEDLGLCLCAIAAKGFNIDLSAWEEDTLPPTPKKFTIMLNGANPKPDPSPIRHPKEPAPKTKESQTQDLTPVQKPQSNTQNRLQAIDSTDNSTQKTSTIQGQAMTSFPHPEFNAAQIQTEANAPAGDPNVLIQGLSAMQQLQAQTARAHELFLETQAEASRTLAALMAQTRGQSLVQPSNAPQTARLNSGPPPETFQTPGPVPTPAPQSIPQPPQEVVKTEAPVSNQTIKSVPEKEESVTSDGPDKIQAILFETVSRLTGFPVEMLEPEMDIESDLGIDSIKKVEIISELEKAFPDSDNLSAESLGSVRTLSDICSAVNGSAVETSSDSLLQDQPLKDQSQPIPGPQSRNESTSGGSDDILDVLVNIISELTGFPKEMLEPEMNLESDLGIDSIKRVEILSRLEQEQPESRSLSPDDMGSLKTIADIVLHLTSDQQTVSTETGKKKTSHDVLTQPDRDKEPVPLKPLVRQEVALTFYPTHQVRFYNGARIGIPSDKTVFLTRDSAGVAKAFKQEFKKLGIKTEIIDPDLDKAHDLSNAAGLVLIPDAFTHPEDEAANRFLFSSFSLASKFGQHLQNNARTGSAFMTCISFLGGNFCFSSVEDQISPAYGGIAGLAKTAHLEWRPVLCRALDLPFDIDAVKKNAEAAVALMLTRGSVEMGLNGEQCCIPDLLNKPISPAQPVDLDASDVVVVTGGARGITAECALALAKACSPKIALFGRSPEPFEEPEWIAGITEPAQMKKAIFANGFDGEKPTPARVDTQYRAFVSNRDIKANLDRISHVCDQVRYYCVDIRDKQKVRDAISRVTRELGTVTALIHGAGVLEDKLICEKSPEQFSRVFGTKVEGLSSLLSAVDETALKYLVLFSSVAARFGNTGQSDYAMANEVMNKMAQAKTASQTHCKTIAINWGPWDGGMVTDGLKREFEKRGIELIPAEQGAGQMVTEMANPDQDGAEVVIGGTIAPNLEKKAPTMNKALTQTFGCRHCPVINDHKIDNAPVVPFALMVDLLACGAEQNNPGLKFAGMDNARLLKGILPGEEQIDVQVDIGKCQTCDDQLFTSATLSSSSSNPLQTLHAKASVLLADTLPSPPALSKAAFMALSNWDISIQEAYSKILFHEGRLQCISKICGVSSKGIEVLTTTAPEISEWYEKPHARQWCMDPMVLDAAFQAAILWAFHECGQVCLPASFANLRVYSSFPQQPLEQIKVLFTVNHQDQHKIKGYFTFLDASDTVVASIMGFEAVISPDLIDKFKVAPLFDRNKILAFALGNPSDAFGEPYKIFDQEREIARLPRPPYFFMDQVIKADHPAWQTAPGGWIESTFNIDKNDWYFTANHSDSMPFCILLEIALQPCGWLAAYGGAALLYDDRLHFRNLGGQACLNRNLYRDAGQIMVRVKMTDVSRAGGMIIENFEMEVLCRGAQIYTGTTNFGFFTSDALANQVGIRNPTAYQELDENPDGPVILFENLSPLTPEDKIQGPDTGMPAKALRMIDEITHLDLNGGIHQNGCIQGVKKVDPEEWFFHAHFYQDPVCPGSLGVESFLQLIRFFLIEKFSLASDQYQPVMTENHPHEWVYRGQIIPSNSAIIVQAHIKEVLMDETGYTATADGALCVDGICIYEMKNFSMSLQPIKAKQDSRADKNQSHAGKVE